MIELKCKKIRGVDKSICTCEQKIAYNYAFVERYRFKEFTKNATTEIQICEAETYIIDFMTSELKRREDMSKYNIDAIVVAFRQGFRKYCKNPFIASDYAQIGEAFPIPYKIK